MSITSIFDLRSLRVIDYDKNAPGWGTILKSKIQNSISETIKAPEENPNGRRPAPNADARPSKSVIHLIRSLGAAYGL